MVIKWIITIYNTWYIVILTIITNNDNNDIIIYNHNDNI